MKLKISTNKDLEQAARVYNEYHDDKLWLYYISESIATSWFTECQPNMRETRICLGDVVLYDFDWDLDEDPEYNG